MQHDRDRAWNNFVLKSDPSDLELDDPKRSAAIASQFMGGANNGGINSFLTATPHVSGQEVVDALATIGAKSAAAQLRAVLAAIGEPIIRCSEVERWEELNRLWSDKLDFLDRLSEQADAELLKALECHVESELRYYLMLGSCETSGSQPPPPDVQPARRS